MVVHDGPFAKDPLNARESARHYFLSDDDVGLIVNSPSGEHRLQFPEGSTVYLAGGNFLLCLCEAFRDVLRGTSGNLEPSATIVFVTDGIYHTLSRFAPAVAEMTEEELEVALGCQSSLAEGFDAIPQRPRFSGFSAPAPARIWQRQGDLSVSA